MYKFAMLVGTPWYAVFEEETADKGAEGGEGGGEGGGGEGDEAAKAAAAEAAKKAEAEKLKNKKLFTQDEINRMMADNKRALQAKNESLIKELETLRKGGNLTAEQKVQLETRIENLQNELLTKEELSKKENEKIQKEHKRIVEATTKERDEWKQRYTAETIHRSITDAAVEHKAVNPKQIVAILNQRATLAPETDTEGNPTGNLVPRVKFETSDKEGKAVVIDISIPEAVKQMKDMEEYFNLFQGEGASGLGASSRATGRSLDIRQAAKDAAKYRELRKQGKI